MAFTETTTDVEWAPVPDADIKFNAFDWHRENDDPNLPVARGGFAKALAKCVKQRVSFRASEFSVVVEDANVQPGKAFLMPRRPAHEDIGTPKEYLGATVVAVVGIDPKDSGEPRVLVTQPEWGGGHDSVPISHIYDFSTGERLPED